MAEGFGILQAAIVCFDIAKDLTLACRGIKKAFTDYSSLNAELRVLDQTISQLAPFLNISKESIDGQNGVSLLSALPKMMLITLHPAVDAIDRHILVGVDSGTTFSGVAWTLSSENHRSIEMQSNAMDSGKQAVNRERLENRSCGLMYHLIDTPGFDDTHRTTTLEVFQELPQWLPQVNGQLTLKSPKYCFELTSTIPRSLTLEANAQGSIESFWNQLMGVAKALKRLHRDKGGLGQNHHRWHADVKPQSVLVSAGSREFQLADLSFSSLSSINVNGAERLDCQFSDKPLRSAPIPPQECAKYLCTISHGSFSNPAAASPGSDYGLGAYAIISHLHGIGGAGKTTIARDITGSLKRDERPESFFWINAEERETRFGLDYLKQTLGSVDFHARPPGGRKLGSLAVDMEDSVSGRYDIWSLGCVFSALLSFTCLRPTEECMYERASISRLTAFVHRPRVLYRYGKGDRDGEGNFVEARDLSLTEGSDRHRGDQEMGPQAGKPNLGREDDDDDDCVGFHRLSGPKYRRGTLQGHRGSFHGSTTDTWKYRAGDVHPGQHTYGPPYRGLVDTTPGKVVVHSPSASMVSIWREAIGRICGERMISDPSPMAWKSVGKEGNADESICMGARRGGNSILCAH